MLGTKKFFFFSFGSFGFTVDMILPDPTISTFLLPLEVCYLPWTHTRTTLGCTWYQYIQHSSPYSTLLFSTYIHPFASCAGDVHASFTVAVIEIEIKLPSRPRISIFSYRIQNTRPSCSRAQTLPLLMLELSVSTWWISHAIYVIMAK